MEKYLNRDELLENCWKAYQTAQGDADVTAKKVFKEVVNNHIDYELEKTMMTVKNKKNAWTEKIPDKDGWYWLVTIMQDGTYRKYPVKLFGIYSIRTVVYKGEMCYLDAFIEQHETYEQKLLWGWEIDEQMYNENQK